MWPLLPSLFFLPLDNDSVYLGSLYTVEKIRPESSTPTWINQCYEVLCSTVQILEINAASSAFHFVPWSSWGKPEGFYIVHSKRWVNFKIKDDFAIVLEVESFEKI